MTNIPMLPREKRLKVEDILLEKINELERELRQTKDKRHVYFGLLREIMRENPQLLNGLREKAETEITDCEVKDRRSKETIREEVELIIEDFLDQDD